jgi:hypothetical protein
MAMYEDLAGVLSIWWFRCLDIRSCIVLLKEQNRRSSCNTSFHYVHNEAVQGAKGIERLKHLSRNSAKYASVIEYRFSGKNGIVRVFHVAIC